MRASLRIGRDNSSADDRWRSNCVIAAIARSLSLLADADHGQVASVRAFYEEAAISYTLE